MTEGVAGRVVAVCRGVAREIPWEGRLVRSAIWKEPVAGRVAVGPLGLAADVQADRRVHGGEPKAVYAYALEDERWWAQALGRPFAPGSFGENLTLEGVDLRGLRAGERWRIGTALLEVTTPRTPCFKLAMRQGDPGFTARFWAAARPGAYLRVVEAGEVWPEAPAVRAGAVPEDGPTLVEVFRRKAPASA